MNFILSFDLLELLGCWGLKKKKSLLGLSRGREGLEGYKTQLQIPKAGNCIPGKERDEPQINSAEDPLDSANNEQHWDPKRPARVSPSPVLPRDARGRCGAGRVRMRARQAMAP